MTEIRVPTLGESVTEATIGQWLKKEGEAVAADEPVVELETDKVSVEVPAPSSGVLASIAAQEGDTVALDALLGEITESTDAATPSTPDTAASAPKSATPSGALVEVTVPASGESVTEADIGEWMVKVGDHVSVDDPLVSLETDKASMDVPAPVSGVVTEIRGAEGDTVEVGTVLALIAEGGAGKATTATVALDTTTSSTTMASPKAASAALSPAPRRVIEEHGLEASTISGSGKNGRITKGDALAALETMSKPQKTKAPHKPRDLGPREERVKMTRLRQTIARRLKESQETAAMLTTFNDVDMTAVMEARKQYKELFEKRHGVKLGFMSFFVKAAITALKDIPDVNAEIDGTDIIYKNHYDIGIAVGTEKGLVVPVLKDADAMSMADIEKSIVDFGMRARSGELKLEEMQGGTFTITNGGIYGSLMSTPILNAPQSGILGMHRIEQRPVAINGEVKIRPMMYLALSYDHRIVDGKGAVTFLVRLKENLEDPQRLLLGL
ncbi:MAG: 2-oxoglutarate dehydrogenase complex dihydrolipoyllysine-residue succinyltransferase [bacterium]